MTLSTQALGTIMMCLQKAILEESDVTEHLASLTFTIDSNEQLQVNNPPSFEIPNDLTSETLSTTGSD